MDSDSRKNRVPYGKLYTLTAGICLAVLLAFLAMYNGFQNALLHSVNTLSQDFIQQVNSTAVSAESILRSLTAQIYNIGSVRKLRTSGALTNTEMIEGIRTLNDFTASSLIVDSIYVYNGKRAYVYSTLSSGAFSDSLEAFRDRDAVELMLNRTAAQRLTPIRRFSSASSSSANRDMISLMVFDIALDGKPGDNALMMNISSAWFSELYFGKNPEDLSFIIDSEGGVIACCDDKPPLNEPAFMDRLRITLPGNSGPGHFTWTLAGGTKLLCLYTGFGSRPWHYVRLIPYEKYATGLLQVQSNVYLLLVIGFLLILAASIFIALRIWFPFSTMRSSLMRYGLEPGSKDPVDQLSGLISRSTDAARIITVLKRTLHDSVLTGILLGQEPGGNTLLQEYNLALCDGEPVDLVFVSSAKTEGMVRIMRAHCPRCEGVLMPGEHTVLLVQPDSRQMMLDSCVDILRRYPSSRVIIGRQAESWDKLAESYAGALERYRLRFLRHKTQNLETAGLPALGDTSALSGEEMGGLIAALKGGNMDAARGSYNGLVFSLQGKTHRAAEISMVNLSSSMLKLYYEVFPDTAPSLVEAENAFARLLESADSIEEIDAYFLERFSHIADKVRLERQSRQERLLDEITRLIHTRLTDDDLCLQSIADLLGMSPAYLGRVFRQSFSMSVGSYITALRMEEAKRLLLDTDASVKEISSRVGIVNTQYFFVLFKQMSGKTPQQFRLGKKNSAGT